MSSQAMKPPIVVADIKPGAVFTRGIFRFEVDWVDQQNVGYAKFQRGKLKESLARMSKLEFVRRFNLGPKAEKKIPEIDVSKP